MYVYATFKLNLGVFMYKHYSNELPEIFSTYFTKHIKTHNYPARNAQDYNINKTKNIFSDCAIRNCGLTFWNPLDKNMKQSKTIKPFWNQLQSLLIPEYKWFRFGGMSCVLMFVYSVFLSVYILWPILSLRTWSLQAFFCGLLFMSSISWCV